MLLKKRSGFTLVELMVVIVIIGVLASLAIPRFTEASAKAKVAEAPRVIGSWESAVLAYFAETGKVPENAADLIFAPPKEGDSKWFKYAPVASKIDAEAISTMSKFPATGKLHSEYFAANGTVGDCFKHSASENANTEARKMVPNFFSTASDACTGTVPAVDDPD